MLGKKSMKNQLGCDTHQSINPDESVQVMTNERSHTQWPVDLPDYYCAQSPDYLETPFKLYQDDITGPKCYQFLKNSGDISGTAKSWDKGKERCEEQGAVLASIHSPQQNAWFSSHIPVSSPQFCYQKM